MLLIDASKISAGGGLVLLRFLLAELSKNNIPLFLIKDIRYQGTDLDIYPHAAYNRIFLNRKKIFESLIAKHKITKILCFGSSPPPLRTKGVTSYTYMHDPNIFNDSILSGYGWKSKLSRFIKEKYIKHHIGNSDYYIFQTPYMIERFEKSYKPKSDINLALYPFYDEAQIETQLKGVNTNNKKFDFCYISIPNPHKNHNILIDAWLILKERGLSPSLVLTIPVDSDNKKYAILEERVKSISNIINIGYVSFETALKHTGESRYCIYPSYSETLGLGYVEAHYLKLPILTSDLPIVHNVINPSLTFDTFDAEDIADKVEFALKNQLPLSELKLENKITEFITLINPDAKSK